MTWENVVRTGNPQSDWQQAMSMKQHGESQGMRVELHPLPQGGIRIRTTPGGAHPHAPPPHAPHPQGAWAPAPQAWQGAPQQLAAAHPGQPIGAAAFAPMPAPFAGAPDATVAEGRARVEYLKKVYGYLLAAAFVGLASGWATLHLGPTAELATRQGTTVQVPILVALMLTNRLIDLGVFAVLFVAITVASSVSKVKGVNVGALLGVAMIMGIEFAPMVWVAGYFGGLGQSMTADPVRDAFAMTGAVFVGATAYVFTTKKDFSFLKATLSMGTIVVLVACLLAFVVHVEAFTLAVCSVGAIVASGLILYQTSRIFSASDMDDPVDDALGLLIQLRNLLLFAMRIFMSRR